MPKISNVKEVAVESNWVHSSRRPPIGPLYLSPGDYEDGVAGGMMIGRGNGSTRRKPAPVPLCPPQIPNELAEREPGPPRWEASD
jgi:hypothetical protein